MAQALLNILEDTESTLLQLLATLYQRLELLQQQLWARTALVSRQAPPTSDPRKQQKNDESIHVLLNFSFSKGSGFHPDVAGLTPPFNRQKIPMLVDRFDVLSGDVLHSWPITDATPEQLLGAKIDLYASAHPDVTALESEEFFNTIDKVLQPCSRATELASQILKKRAGGRSMKERRQNAIKKHKPQDDALAQEQEPQGEVQAREQDRDAGSE